MTEPLSAEPCKLMTLHVGPTDCLDGECDEYATEDGDWAGIDACSHIRQEEVCETHSTLKGEGGEWEHYDPVEPWPCQHDPARAAAVEEPADA